MRERENERMRVVKNKKTVHVPKWKVCVSQKGKRPFLRSLRLCFLGARLFLDGASLGFQSLLVCLLGPLFPASNAPKSQREREKKVCVCVCVSGVSKQRSCCQQLLLQLSHTCCLSILVYSLRFLLLITMRFMFCQAEQSTSIAQERKASVSRKRNPVQVLLLGYQKTGLGKKGSSGFHQVKYDVVICTLWH